METPNPHATFHCGGKLLPLIGVPAGATAERCDRCGRLCHLSRVLLCEGGFTCVLCLMRDEVVFPLELSHLTQVT